MVCLDNDAETMHIPICEGIAKMIKGSRNAILFANLNQIKYLYSHYK